MANQNAYLKENRAEFINKLPQIWLVITGVIALIMAAASYTRLPKILLFWAAFILTRPFGATFGDVLTKTHDKGGLDFGRGYSSLILLTILAIAIVVSYRKKEAEQVVAGSFSDA